MSNVLVAIGYVVFLLLLIAPLALASQWDGPGLLPSLGCDAIGEESGVNWLRLKLGLREWLVAAAAPGNASVPSLVVSLVNWEVRFPSLLQGVFSVAGAERYALRRLCGLAPSTSLCTAAVKRRQDHDVSLRSECPLGVISLVLALHVEVATYITSAAPLASTKRDVSGRVIEAALVYLDSAVRRGLPSPQPADAALRLVLAGWPIFGALVAVADTQSPIGGPGSRSRRLYQVRQLSEEGVLFCHSVFIATENLRNCMATAKSSAAKYAALRLEQTKNRIDLSLSLDLASISIPDIRGPKNRALLYSALEGFRRRPQPDLRSLWGKESVLLWGALNGLQSALVQMGSDSQQLQRDNGGFLNHSFVWPPDTFFQTLSMENEFATCMDHAACRLGMIAFTEKGMIGSVAWHKAPKVAFVTVLGGFAAGDDLRMRHWVEGIVVLRYSAVRFHPSTPMVVICDETVGSSTIKQLTRHRLHVVTIWANARQHVMTNDSARAGLGAAALEQDILQKWLRLHVWSLVQFERVVYFDIESLVLHHVSALLELPSHIALAVVVFGTPTGSRPQRLDFSVVSLVPDKEVFRAMLAMDVALSSEGAKGDSTEWLNLFWQERLGYESSDALPFCSNLSSLEPPISACLLDARYNVPVSYSSVMSSDGRWIQACVEIANAGCAGGQGFTVVHWPGQRSKPWLRPGGRPWTQTVLDEMWWEAREVAHIGLREEELFGAWRTDGRCGPIHLNAYGEEGECERGGVTSCCNPNTGWCGATEAHCLCRNCINFASESTDTTPLFPEFLPPEPNPSAAVLILARMNSLAAIRKLGRLLRGVRSCQWIAVRRAPVIILHDAGVHAPCNMGFRTNACVKVFGDWGPFAQFLNVSEVFVSPEKYKGKAFINKFPLSYAIMCEFWGSMIFKLDRLQNLRYYMRLDDDATVSCSPSDSDPFTLLETRGAHYGYYKLTRDEWQKVFVPGFREHLRGHLVSQGQSMADILGLAEEALSPQHPAPFFYNNFEVVDMAYFRNAVVSDYTASVIASEGIYKNLWGDATIRYGQLLVGRGHALCLDGLYGYCHQQCCMTGVGQCFYPAGSCQGNSKDGAPLNLSHWSVPS